jgi:D-3-phosphoglycerate dehydrogenase
VPAYSENLKRGTWQATALDPAFNGLGRVLKGRTLGIWGYGRIGRLVASYARAFGMRVLVWGRDASLALAQQDGLEAASSRAAFFAEADVLTLHLRLNDATRGIVTAQDLGLMKPDALIVNTSRAELVAPGALLEALQAGRPGFAALDVFESEPLAPDSPYLRMPNVLATPHLGYVENDSYELYFRAAFENVLSFAAGKPAGILNKEALAARS